MMKPILMAFVVSLSAAHGSSLSPCFVRIQSYKHNGEQVRVSFETPLRSEQECATLAKMHQSNFTPSSVRSKKVSYIWGSGKRTEQLASREKVRYRKAR